MTETQEDLLQRELEGFASTFLRARDLPEEGLQIQIIQLPVLEINQWNKKRMVLTIKRLDNGQKTTLNLASLHTQKLLKVAGKTVGEWINKILLVKKVKQMVRDTNKEEWTFDFESVEEKVN